MTRTILVIITAAANIMIRHYHDDDNDDDDDDDDRICNSVFRLISLYGYNKVSRTRS
jgi:hypothetical protein